MMDDETKKTMDLVQREMVRALAPHIGTKPDREAVRDTVQKMLDQLQTDKKIETEVLAEVVGDTIKLKLKQPSFLNEILPKLEGPYAPWPDIDGLVHVGGRLGTWNVRVCDFVRLENQPAHWDVVVTCLNCLILNPPP